MIQSRNAIWFIVGLSLLSACKEKKAPERVPVVVEQVGVRDVEIFGEYVGKVRAQQFVEVRARVEGYLEKMLFEEGKKVERNQPLFIINPDIIPGQGGEGGGPAEEG